MDRVGVEPTALVMSTSIFYIADGDSPGDDCGSTTGCALIVGG